MTWVNMLRILLLSVDGCLSIQINPFPIEDLFNTTFTNMLDEYKFDILCGDGGERHVGCCSCHPSCLYIQSCCIDYLWYNSNISFTSLPKYLDFLVNATNQYTKATCIDPLPLLTKEGYEQKTYFAIATCKDGSSEYDQKMCSDDGSLDNIFLPVVDSNEVLYKNQHCARCNSVKKFKAVALTLVCRDTKIDTSTCQFHIEMKGQVIECFDMKRCEPGNKYYDLCHAFLGPIHGYANYYCYLCENSTPLDQYILDFDRCVHDPSIRGLTWSFLLQFQDPPPKAHGSMVTKQRCSASYQILDSLAGHCNSFFCPNGYQAVDSFCKKKTLHQNIKNAKGRNFDDCFNNRRIYLATVNINNRTRAIIENLGIFEVSFDYEGGREFVSLLNTSHPQLNINRILFDLENTIKHLEHNESIILGPYLSSLAYSHALSPSQMFPNHQYCSKSILLKSSTYTFTNNCEIVYNDNVIERLDLTMWIEVNGSGTTRHASICKAFFMSSECPLRKVIANWTLFRNKSLVEQVNGKTMETYDPEEYTLLENGQYGVCIDSNIEMAYPWKTILEKAEIYLSTVGAACSVLGYTMVTTTFFCFKEIRNTPSFCAVCLCICLFFADGLFLLINILSFFSVHTSETTCSWMGILMHFWLLSTQFWGVVMAVDIRCNATSMLMNRSIQKARLIKLAATAFSLSLLIVIMTNIFRHVGISYVSYSQDQLCTLQGFYARIVFYAAPLLISLIVSMLLLLSYILNISKEKRIAQVSLGNRYGNCINIGKIALKLIVIFGLSEISGFVRIYKDVLNRDELIFNYVFRILYSTVKGFRGVMLFFVYVCRRSVIILFRKRMKKKRNDLGQSSHPTNIENTM